MCSDLMYKCTVTKAVYIHFHLKKNYILYYYYYTQFKLIKMEIKERARNMVGSEIKLKFTKGTYVCIYCIYNII